MAKPTVNSVHIAVTQLSDLVNAQAETIKLLQDQLNKHETTMADELNAVKVDYEGKLIHIKADYDGKLAKITAELKTTIDVDANATLRTVTGFFQTHDKRMSEIACNVDINDDRSNKNKVTIDAVVEELKQYKLNRVESERPTRERVQETHNNFIESDTPIVIGEASLTLQSLESRIDKLEDYSRRDNLLFTGFREEMNESCIDKIKWLICSKILPEDETAHNFQFVRVHRLGKYVRGHTRPIIARFVSFEEKQKVLMSCKNLSSDEPQKFFVSEDFSQNTTGTRKSLHAYVKDAKKKLDKRIKGMYVKYKFLAVRLLNGKLKTFSLHQMMELAEQNPRDWWEYLLASNRDATRYGGNKTTNPYTNNDGTAAPRSASDGAGSVALGPVSDPKSDKDGGNSPTGEGTSTSTDGVQDDTEGASNEDFHDSIDSPIVEDGASDAPSEVILEP